MRNLSSTRSQVFSLGKALAFQNALGILVPIVLVRLIDVTQYGQYRLFWLIAGTVMLIAPLGMPRSLMYFLPRSTPAEKRIYVYQVFLFLIIAASLSAMIVGPWNPLLSEKLRNIVTPGIIVPTFVFFWVLSSMIDVLPNADLNIRWQSLIIIFLSITRVATVLGAAMWKKDIKAVFLALVAFSILKALILLYYSVRHHGWIPLRLDWKMMWGQLCYAVPFGLANIAYTFRRQAEMWVVAIIFSTSTLPAHP
jgi:O-antigen/teichoic acid export membrane protein